MSPYRDIHDIVVPSQFPDPGAGSCKLAFVGDAGRMFNVLLRAAGIERGDCYVGNVYDTKLEENEVSAHRVRLGYKWQEFHDRNLTRLSEELARVAPTVVVPLGGTALLALAGNSRISSFRGHATPGLRPLFPYKLVPTVHPSHVRRNWKMFVPTVHDLVRATVEADAGPAVVHAERTFYLNPSIEEVEEYLHWCEAAELVSVDIETGWGMIRGISFARSASEAMYVPFIAINKPSKNYWDSEALERRAWVAVRTLLASPVPKLGQNFGAYDALWLLDKAGLRVNNYCQDLRLLHKALYPELPAALEFMAGAYSRQGPWKHFVDHSGSTRANRGERRDD